MGYRILGAISFMNNPGSATHIALLVNPLAGNHKANAVATTIGARLAALQVTHSIFVGDWPRSLEEFTEVWIVGGDGTINYYLNHYPPAALPLAFFKAGTGNDIHWKLYGNMPVEAQVEHVLHAPPRKLDVAQCNGKFYINSSGIGFDGEVLHSMGTIRWMGGHLGYLWVVIRKIFSFREKYFRIRVGAEQLDGKYLLVAINNSSRTGGGFLVTPDASLHDGKLDVVLCEALPIWKRLRYLPVIEKGRHLDLPFIHYRQEASIIVEAEQELFAQLDGELITGRSFAMNVLPDHLLVKY